jgi:hypothetical protein
MFTPANRAPNTWTMPTAASSVALADVRTSTRTGAHV